MAVTENTLGNDRVERYSDAGVKIRNSVTGALYSRAEDYTNEWRISHGLEPFTYIETAIPNEPYEYGTGYGAD